MEATEMDEVVKAEVSTAKIGASNKILTLPSEPVCSRTLVLWTKATRNKVSKS
jgi:hypothetical protein